MDFQAYRETITRIQSSKFTARQRRLNALSRILNRKQYSHIQTPFSQERQGNNATGQRILLDNRRAAVQEPLAIELVRDQCGLLFGEDHRPLVLARKDPKTTEWIAAFLTDTKFWLTMVNALWKGSVGSCAVVLRVLGKQKTQEVPSTTPESDEAPKVVSLPDGPGRFYFEVWDAEECRPVFDRTAPDRLIELDRRYFIGEDALRAQGYDFTALQKYWDEKSPAWRQGSKRVFQRAGGDIVNDWVVRLDLNTKEEVWYKPVPKFVYERRDWDENDWIVDEDRTVAHDLGVVPAEWVVPLPISSDEYYPDGACLFEPVIDFQFRIDRTLSQTGRAFDYAGDPQLARIRGENGGLPGGIFGQDSAMGGTASDVIEVDEKGEAKFVEITGEGLRISIETYVKALEDIAKRAGAMSRIVPESSSGASAELSSAAMKLLNTPQLTLSGVLRITCGEFPGEQILRLAMKMFDEYDVELPSLAKGLKPNLSASLEWQWPDYYEPVGQEKLFEVQAVNAAAEAYGISHETQVANLGPLFDVRNTEDEIEKINTTKADDMTHEVALANEMGKIEARTGAAVQAKKKAQQKGATPKSGQKN